jgi:hypothetical protein
VRILTADAHCYPSVVLRHLAQQAQHDHLFLKRFQHRADAEREVNVGPRQVRGARHDHPVFPAALGQAIKTSSEGLRGLPLSGADCSHHCWQGLGELVQRRASK